MSWKSKAKTHVKTILSETADASSTHDSSEPVTSVTPADSVDSAVKKQFLTSPKLFAIVPIIVVFMVLIVAWWLGPQGYFYVFDPYEYDRMSPETRTMAGIGVDLRVVRARLTHNRDWLRRSLFALGNYRLLRGDEKGAVAAYEEAVQYVQIFEIQRPEIRTLIALHAKQGHWSEAYRLLKLQVARSMATRHRLNQIMEKIDSFESVL